MVFERINRLKASYGSGGGAPIVQNDSLVHFFLKDKDSKLLQVCHNVKKILQ